jgi:NAD(P)-dependent dehydrogenase (short-subunit alcohol dehydrogenase family)
MVHAVKQTGAPDAGPMAAEPEDPSQSRRPSRGVLVTGASGGIGAATARAFAALGDRVALHFLSGRDRVEEVRSSLTGSGHRVVQADLADADAVRGMVDEAWVGLHGVDVVVNNAGTSIEHPVADVTYRQWQDAWAQTLAVNLVGAANVSYCAARLMIDRGGGGRIVNVSSRGAFRGEPRMPAYAASKAGLNLLGQSLAVALAQHGIAVATLAPGFVETGKVADRLAGFEGASIRAQSPFGRVARPDEVAAAVVYLASAEAEWASGAVLDLNGASYLR